MDYPDDATGEALRGIAADGSDMTKPMSIDFSVSAPNEQAARAIAAAATARGYTVDVSPDEDEEDEDEEDEEEEDEEEEEEEDEDGESEGDDDAEDASGASEADEITWTCNCQRRKVATYDAIVAVQAELDALSEPHGGYSDGWGSFGNKNDT